MILQTTGSKGLLYKLIERAIIESHCDQDYTFNVLNTKKIKSDYREAIKKSYDIQDIDDNDILICFEDKLNSTPTEQAPEEKPEQEQQPVDNNTDQAQAKDNTEDKPQDTETQEDQPKDTDQQEQAPEEHSDDSEDDEDADDEDQEEVEKAVKEALMEDEDDGQAPENTEPEKVDDATSQENKEAIEQSGTTATESKGREKLIKAVARALYINETDEVETFDVDFNGQKTFFIKLNIRK